MAVPASGQIFFSKIARELKYNSYYSAAAQPNPVSLTDMSTGNYENESINTANSSIHRPDQIAPHSAEEFHNYDHDKVIQMMYKNYNFSDIKLKENIIEIGKSKSNIPIYEFNYIGESERYQGAMAQDLLNMNRKDAVKIHINGNYIVDYSKIDVEFKRKSYE